MSKTTRRSFLKTASAAGLVGSAATGCWTGGNSRVSRSAGKKVIIIGVDGMDPRLSEAMMKAGELPNLAKLRASGGFSDLGTSTPPQSPVAWANFINGAGPGSHGIFDFLQRHPNDPTHPYFSISDSLPGEGGLETGDYKIPLDFWPFSHKPPKTVLLRQGTPFWDYLDAQGIPTTFYDLPSNYPASPSHHGHHRCLCGMGTPDMLGTQSTYQFYSEDGPAEPIDKGGGRHAKLAFDNETARLRIMGPPHGLLKTPTTIEIEGLVHRDRKANAAVLQIGKKRIVLKPGQWTNWQSLDFEMSMPGGMPSTSLKGICRVLLQEVGPNFRLYISPINIDPGAPAVPVSEPASFSEDIASKIGSYATVGFQEDHRARFFKVFNDEEYLRQTNFVLEERLRLLEYAINNYDDGLLFFYFSSSDLQSHMFWWTPGEKHPTRTPPEAEKFNNHIRKLYQRLDTVIGELHQNYGSKATIIVMSDHGFANWGRQFNLNTWLRDHDYIPQECTKVLQNGDWSRIKAYGLGINGIYLNLKGREVNGIVEPGQEADELMETITNQLVEGTKDFDGKPVVRGVYRSKDIYNGPAAGLAPDLVVGYHRGFRASWDTILGDVSEKVFSDNTEAWSADHCMDALEVPGVLWCNHQIKGKSPSLVDIAPSILSIYGLETPKEMTGKNVFG